MRIIFYCLFIALASALPMYAQVTMVGEGVISSAYDDLNAAFMPDGKTVYFSLNHPRDRFGIIVYSQWKNGKWSEPQVPSFSGTFTDYDPFITADGAKLYYCSTRSGNGIPKQDFDIFVVEKTGDGWSEPKNISTEVNDDRNQYYPSLSKNGNLYFNSNKDGSYDLFVSKLVNGQYQKPEKLLGKINGDKTNEGDAVIAPDESYIIFAAYGRPDTNGSGDLYISYNENGIWSEPINLGLPINSAVREYCPILSPDGKTLYFTSFRSSLDKTPNKPIKTFRDFKNFMNQPENGLGNVYQVSMELVLNKK